MRHHPPTRAVRGLVVLVAAVLLVGCTQGRSREVDALVADLPAPFLPAEVEDEERDALEERFRDEHGASDVAVAQVEAPQRLAPLGVKVVAFRLRRPTTVDALAEDLSRNVPLRGAVHRTVAGADVVAHDADETFASTVLWLRDGRTAVLVYAGTAAEVEAVLAAVIDRST